VTRTWE